jgi:hypothetical protein
MFFFFYTKSINQSINQIKKIVFFSLASSVSGHGPWTCEQWDMVVVFWVINAESKGNDIQEGLS